MGVFRGIAPPRVSPAFKPPVKISRKSNEIPGDNNSMIPGDFGLRGLIRKIIDFRPAARQSHPQTSETVHD